MVAVVSGVNPVGGGRGVGAPLPLLVGLSCAVGNREYGKCLLSLRFVHCLVQ